MTDFQRRARTIGQLRRTRDVLGNVVSGRRMFSSAGRREGQSSGNGYLTIAGIVTAVIGGGGLLARGRKALKLLTQDVHEAKNEAHGRVADIEARVNAEQEQLVQLTEAVDAIRAQLSTMAVPTPPAPPHPLAPPPVTRA